jgi:hypothetical protein
MSSRNTDLFWALVGFSIMAAMFAVGLAANEITCGDMAIVASFVLFAALFGMTWNSMVRARRERQQRERQEQKHQANGNGRA